MLSCTMMTSAQNPSGLERRIKDFTYAQAKK